MKKISRFAIGLSAFVFFCAMTGGNGTTISVDKTDIKMPDWQWTSGPLKNNTIGKDVAFTLAFDPKVYNMGDDVKITFTYYSVTLGDVPAGTSFAGWRGNSIVVNNQYANWNDLIHRQTDRMQQPHHGNSTTLMDTMMNCTIINSVSSTRKWILSINAQDVTLLTADNKPIVLTDASGGPTLTTNIKGIEIEKVTK